MQVILITVTPNGQRFIGDRLKTFLPSSAKLGKRSRQNAKSCCARKCKRIPSTPYLSNTFLISKLENSCVSYDNDELISNCFGSMIDILPQRDITALRKQQE